MNSNPILTFDTSGINQLADDPDSEALIAGLRSGFYFRLTFLSVSEIIANKKRNRRVQLLRTCRQLVSSGDCIDPPHEIVRKTVIQFEEPPAFDWTRVSVDFPEAQNAIAHEEDFGDELADQEREESRSLQRQFTEIYDAAKPAFDRLFESGVAKRPVSVSNLVAQLQAPEGSFWTHAKGFYSRVGKHQPDDATIQRFTEMCDPFRALMIAFCGAHYDRCIRPQNVSPSLRSGRIDTFMATYLPYCHQFVTADHRQLALFKEVVSVAGLHVIVKSYEEFRDRLLVMGTAAGALDNA
jgi:hypothetical protein